MLIDNITTNHQFEIQQILKDAAVRIGKFKEIVDTKQNQVNNEVIIEKLTKKYEQEKGIVLIITSSLFIHQLTLVLQLKH